MKIVRFLYYFFFIAITQVVFSIGYYLCIPDKWENNSLFFLVGLILNLIFVAKFWFLSLTEDAQSKKPELWVNANLLAFAVKFILIIVLMVILGVMAKEGVKHLIIWTTISYTLLIIVDNLFYLKFPKNK